MDPGTPLVMANVVKTAGRDLHYWHGDLASCRGTAYQINMRYYGPCCHLADIHRHLTAVKGEFT